MERATAPDLRKSMELADLFKRAGVRFIPVPVEEDAAFESCYTGLMEGMQGMVAKHQTALAEAGRVIHQVEEAHKEAADSTLMFSRDGAKWIPWPKEGE